MKVFEALFNPCIHESGFVTLSLHKTKEGAERAVAYSKKEAYDEWLTTSEKWKNATKEEFPYDLHLDWHIKETEILD